MSGDRFIYGINFGVELFAAEGIYLSKSPAVANLAPGPEYNR